MDQKCALQHFCSLVSQKWNTATNIYGCFFMSLCLFQLHKLFSIIKIINGVNPKIVQGLFFFLQSYRREWKNLLWYLSKPNTAVKSKQEKSCIAPKQWWNWGNKYLQYVMGSFSNQNPSIFHTEVFRVSHNSQIVLSVLCSNTANLTFPSLQENTRKTHSEWIYFQIPLCTAEQLKDQKKHQSRFCYSLWPWTCT